MTNVQFRHITDSWRHREKDILQTLVSHKSHLETSVDQSTVIELFEDPPYTLHKPRVECLVIVFEVNPTAESVHNVLRIWILETLFQVCSFHARPMMVTTSCIYTITINREQILTLSAMRQIIDSLVRRYLPNGCDIASLNNSL